MKWRIVEIPFFLGQCGNRAIVDEKDFIVANNLTEDNAELIIASVEYFMRDLKSIVNPITNPSQWSEG